MTDTTLALQVHPSISRGVGDNKYHHHRRHHHSGDDGGGDGDGVIETMVVRTLSDAIEWFEQDLRAIAAARDVARLCAYVRQLVRVGFDADNALLVVVRTNWFAGVEALLADPGFGVSLHDGTGQLCLEFCVANMDRVDCRIAAALLEWRDPRTYAYFDVDAARVYDAMAGVRDTWACVHALDTLVQNECLSQENFSSLISKCILVSRTNFLTYFICFNLHHAEIGSGHRYPLGADHLQCAIDMNDKPMLRALLEDTTMRVDHEELCLAAARDAQTMQILLAKFDIDLNAHADLFCWAAREGDLPLVNLFLSWRGGARGRVFDVEAGEHYMLAYAAERPAVLRAIAAARRVDFAAHGCRVLNVIVGAAARESWAVVRESLGDGKPLELALKCVRNTLSALVLGGEGDWIADIRARTSRSWFEDHVASRFFVFAAKSGAPPAMLRALYAPHLARHRRFDAKELARAVVKYDRADALDTLIELGYDLREGENALLRASIEGDKYEFVKAILGWRGRGGRWCDPRTRDIYTTTYRPIENDDARLVRLLMDWRGPRGEYIDFSADFSVVLIICIHTESVACLEALLAWRGPRGEWCDPRSNAHQSYRMCLDPANNPPSAARSDMMRMLVRWRSPDGKARFDARKF